GRAGRWEGGSCDGGGLGQEGGGRLAVAEAHERGAVEDERGERGECALPASRIVQVGAPLEEEPGAPDGALVGDDERLVTLGGRPAGADRCDHPVGLLLERL